MVVIKRPIGLGASIVSAGDTGLELLSATNPDVYTQSATDPLNRIHLFKGKGRHTS